MKDENTDIFTRLERIENALRWLIKEQMLRADIQAYYVGTHGFQAVDRAVSDIMNGNK